MVVVLQEAAIRPDVSCFSATISALEKGGQWEEALNLFGAIVAARISPYLFASRPAAMWQLALSLRVCVGARVCQKNLGMFEV